MPKYDPRDGSLPLRPRPRRPSHPEPPYPSYPSSPPSPRYWKNQDRGPRLKPDESPQAHSHSDDSLSSLEGREWEVLLWELHM
ncbi:hypothetical protein N658DRAFT_143790 [Parathielavia hyrcaniae]|uniref:Uncharacterized protein n=1 Tax=Parathielavia hyrcaniae TaxID=113614 RepID=A0AAN6PY94_9PEZI|nr:hypothetical protein N658DRAFT_143790 [Parathielavia hyrcaniae]